MSEIWQLSARDLLAAYRELELSPLDVLDALAARIEAVEPRLNAFTTLALDRARAEAAEVTHVPTADAAVIRRTKAAGAILVGKSSTHEFARGITSENPHFGPSRNPWRPDRVSGGSSGDSAVALAALDVPLALGSDTGGSIRVPAAFRGVVGMKPTYGRVSTAGMFPLGSGRVPAVRVSDDDRTWAATVRGRNVSSKAATCRHETVPFRRRTVDLSSGLTEGRLL